MININYGYSIPSNPYEPNDYPLHHTNKSCGPNIVDSCHSFYVAIASLPLFEKRLIIKISSQISAMPLTFSRKSSMIFS